MNCFEQIPAARPGLIFAKLSLVLAQLCQYYMCAVTETVVTVTIHMTLAADAVHVAIIV